MDKACPFCVDPSPVLENELALARHDKFPVSVGHLLIIPKRHVADFFHLTGEERLAVFALLDESRQMLKSMYDPDGFNVGINVGAAAGQTVWHAHVHLIPRYAGDMEDPRGGVRGVIPAKRRY